MLPNEAIAASSIVLTSSASGRVPMDQLTTIHRSNRLWARGRPCQRAVGDVDEPLLARRRGAKVAVQQVLRCRADLAPHQPLARRFGAIAHPITRLQGAFLVMVDRALLGVPGAACAAPQWLRRASWPGMTIIDGAVTCPTGWNRMRSDQQSILRPGWLPRFAADGPRCPECGWLRAAQPAAHVPQVPA